MILIFNQQKYCSNIKITGHTHALDVRDDSNDVRSQIDHDDLEMTLVILTLCTSVIKPSQYAIET